MDLEALLEGVLSMRFRGLMLAFAVLFTSVRAQALEMPREQKELDSALLAAALLGDASGSEELLRHGARVNAMAPNLETPLLRAVREGHQDLVNLLLQKGGWVHWENEAGETALHLAAAFGRDKILMSLLEEDRSPATDSMEEAPQHPDLERRDNKGQTPLHLAAETGNTEGVKLLLAAGAIPEALDGRGWTPLHYAVAGDHLETAKVLLDEEDKIAARYKGPSDFQTGRYESGPVQNRETQWANAPHQFACGELLGFGGDDRTTLTAEWRDDYLNLLRQEGDKAPVYVNTRTQGCGPLRSRDTPLHIAAYFGYQDLVEELTQRGALMNLKNQDGSTPLDEAFNYEDTRVRLMELGGKP